jgi:hypothetical protein
MIYRGYSYHLVAVARSISRCSLGRLLGRRTSKIMNNGFPLPSAACSTSQDLNKAFELPVMRRGSSLRLLPASLAQDASTCRSGPHKATREVLRFLHCWCRKSPSLIPSCIHIFPCWYVRVWQFDLVRFEARECTMMVARVAMKIQDPIRNVRRARVLVDKLACL